MYKKQFRRQKLHCNWPTCVEQSSSSTVTGNELFAIQAATENISVWELSQPQCFVTRFL